MLDCCLTETDPEISMSPDLLYLMLVVTHVESAIRSARERKWHEVVHHAIAALAYIGLVIIGVLPLLLVMQNPSVPST
jgi:hypothetical protein